MDDELSIISPSWLAPASLTEAASIQREMAANVINENAFSKVEYIAGMDVSNNPRDPKQLIYASAVVLDAKTLEIVETVGVSQVQTMPYVSGFLGFREAPALVQAYQQLKQKPDLIFVDGHGISHPRGLGIASHIGVLLNKPTIGVAKNILVGKPAGILPAEAGTQVPLIWRNKIIAMLVRSKLRSNPLIISLGHRINLETAVEFVKCYLRGYRLPEPTRQAHLAANAQRVMQ